MSRVWIVSQTPVVDPCNDNIIIKKSQSSVGMTITGQENNMFTLVVIYLCLNSVSIYTS